VVLVAVAATLWASDAYFRARLIGHLTATQIVVLEDALVSLFLVVFLIRGLPEMRRLSGRGWAAIGLIALGPQAIATILFTTSFSYGHFAETFVLQQTQPLIAILLAWIVAALIRVATGSATVAMTTAAGIVAPIAAAPPGTHVELLVLATGAG